MSTEIHFQSNIQNTTFKREDEGIRVQLTLIGGLVANPETISINVILPHQNPSIQELQVKAVTHSIVLLQQFLICVESLEGNG